MRAPLLLCAGLLTFGARAAAAQGEVDVLCSVGVTWCESLAEAFRGETGVAVKLTLKDGADALGYLAAERATPHHDVWYSAYGDAQLRALDGGLFVEYRSPLLPMLKDWALRQFEQAQGRSAGVHASVVAIGYNSKALAGKRLPEPRCWADLARPEYRGELHFAHPAASRIGYMTLATLVQIFGEDRAFELLKDVHRNATPYAVTPAGAIRAVARGEATIGVTMLHDGAAEIAGGFPVKLVVPCEGTGYDVGAIAILAGAPNPANAKRFYDWMLAPAAQHIAASERNFRYPANRNAPDPFGAPASDELRLIRYDFVRYEAAVEHKRLVEKWERDVHALPR